MGFREKRGQFENLELPHELRRAIYGFVVRNRVVRLLMHAGIVLSAAAALVFVCCFADRWLSLSSGQRMGLLAALGAGFVAGLAWPMRKMPLGKAQWIAAAEQIEKLNPRFDQRLVTLVSQYLEPSENQGSRAILDGLMEEIRKLLPLGRNVGRRVMLKMMWAWVLAGGVGIGGSLVAWSAGDEGRVLALRLFYPTEAFSPVSGGVVEIQTPRNSLAKGETLYILARSNEPEAMEIFIDSGSGFIAGGMLPEGREAYVYQTPMPDRDVTFYVKAGKTVSRTLTVKSAKPPRVRTRRAVMMVDSNPTASPIVLKDAGFMTVPLNATVKMEIETDRQMSQARLEFAGRSVEFRIMAGGKRAEATWVCDSSNEADLQIRGADDQSTRIGEFCQWRIKANDIPMAEILDIPRVVCYLPTDVAGLNYVAGDDGRIVNLVIQFLMADKPPRIATLAPPKYGETARGRFVMDLSSLDLEIGDVLEVSIQAVDEQGLISSSSSYVRIYITPNRIEPRELNLVGRMASIGEIVGDMRDLIGRVRQWATAQGADSAEWLGASRLLGKAAERAVALERELAGALPIAGLDNQPAFLKWMDRAGSLSGRLALLNQWDLSERNSAGDLALLSRSLEDLQTLENEIQIVSIGLRAKLALKCLANLNSVQAEASEEIRLLGVGLLEPVGLALDAQSSQTMEKYAAAATGCVRMLESAPKPDYVLAAREWARAIRNRISPERLEYRLLALAAVEETLPEGNPRRGAALRMTARLMSRLSRDADEIVVWSPEKIDEAPRLLAQVISSDPAELDRATSELKRLLSDEMAGVATTRDEMSGRIPRESDPDLAAALSVARERLAEMPQRLLALSTLRDKRFEIEERLKELNAASEGGGAGVSAINRQLDQVKTALKETNAEMEESAEWVSPENVDRIMEILSPYENRIGEGLNILGNELRPALEKLMTTAKTDPEGFKSAYAAALAAVDRIQRAIVPPSESRQEDADRFKPSDEQYEQPINLYFQLIRDKGMGGAAGF